jgi:hypothetical protein
MTDLILKAPLNALSFGNVSFNLLRAMFKKGLNVGVFPIGNVEVSSFGQQEEGFKKWLEDAINNRFQKVSKDIPTLQMWHLNGSENRITPNQTLYTFYELDSPTDIEKTLAQLQDNVVFSSSFAASHFEFDNISFSPLGLDPDIKKTGKSYLQGKTHFGLMGKFEKRKHTSKIIKLWAKKYGNNYKYQLTCCITNPFYKKEQMEQEISNTLEGKRYGNINFLPFLPQNAQVNDYLNSIDIDLGGASGAEGWNLPSFNATCLGKWSVVLNASSHKDWATRTNSILLEPNGKEPVYDNVFFKEGAPFNQGNIYTFDDDEFIHAMEQAEVSCENENAEGLKLGKQLTYENTLDKILSVMGI